MASPTELAFASVDVEVKVLDVVCRMNFLRVQQWNDLSGGCRRRYAPCDTRCAVPMEFRRDTLIRLVRGGANLRMSLVEVIERTLDCSALQKQELLEALFNLVEDNLSWLLPDSDDDSDDMDDGFFNQALYGGRR